MRHRFLKNELSSDLVEKANVSLMIFPSLLPLPLPCYLLIRNFNVDPSRRR